MPRRRKDYDRIAVVTGSDSGIGEAIAIRLARDGFDIGVTWHTDEDGARDTVKKIADAGRRAELERLDLARPADVTAAMERLADRLGGIGVLVNCAGAGDTTPVLDLTYQRWREVLTVDLDGPFLCSQWAARRMATAGRGGRIINITSVHEHRPLVGASAYCAAKAGLGGFGEVLALELAEHGITVNAVAPGEIATAMTGNEDVDPFTVERPGIPLGRPGDAREVAAVVALLASPEAGYVTGASWVIDGGMLLMGPQAGHHLNSTDWRQV